MAPDLLLPLFPLEVVLFPKAALPLHIFEERYKLMVGEAIAQQSEFGIVLAQNNGLAKAGCTAAIENVIKQYPDGRLDISTVGRRRFEILFLDQQKPYLQGGVQFFEDDPEPAPGGEALERLQGLFGRAQALLPELNRPDPKPGAESFSIAEVLPLELPFKQRLLTLRSEAGRVASLTEHLEKLIPRLARAQKVGKSARTNGHGA